MKKTSASTKRARKKNARNSRRANLLPWVILAVVVVLFFVFFTGSQSLTKLYDLKQKERSLSERKQRLLQENDTLEQQIRKLKSDEKYQEKVAREKFNMKKKDEDVYIIEPK